MSGYGAKKQERILRHSIKTCLKKGMPEWVARYCEASIKRANWRVENAIKNNKPRELIKRAEQRHIDEICTLQSLLWGWTNFSYLSNDSTKTQDNEVAP